jgi:hypothetical protein
VRTNYVLIDYENVQPTDLALLTGGPFKVKVFLGPQQKNIPVDLVASLQGLDAKYEQLVSKGRNAVDFHIAYYIGVLSTQDSSAFFHVISKDTGFDPLLEHLQKAGVRAHRSASITSIPYFKPATPCDPQVDAAVAHLAKFKAKPRTEKKLLNTLNSWFKKELSEPRISALLSALRTRGIVKDEGTKVTYKLPTGPK